MPGGLNKVTDKSYSKGKEIAFWKTNHPKKKLDTKEDPHNNHTIEDQGQSWILILIEVHPSEKNCLISRRMELKNQETKAIAEEKGT